MSIIIRQALTFQATSAIRAFTAWIMRKIFTAIRQGKLEPILRAYYQETLSFSFIG